MKTSYRFNLRSAEVIVEIYGSEPTDDLADLIQAMANGVKAARGTALIVRTDTHEERI